MYVYSLIYSVMLYLCLDVFGHVKSCQSIYQTFHTVASQVLEYQPSEGETVCH